MKNLFRALSTTIVLFFCILFANLAFSQTPSNSELEEIDLNSKSLALQEKEYDFMKKRIDAMRASSSIDSPNIENSIMASQSSGCVAQNLLSRLKSGNRTTVVIFSDEIPEKLREYQAISKYINNLNQEYKKPPKVNKGFSLGISEVAALATIFKTDISYKGSVLETEKNQFIANLLKMSIDSGVNFIIPGRIFSWSESLPLTGIEQSLNELLYNYLSAYNEKVTEGTQKKAHILLAQFGLIQDDKIKKYDTQLPQLVKMEQLEDKLEKEEGKYYWLELTEVKSGATTKIDKGLVRSTFTPSRINMIAGGSIVSFILYDKTGNVVDAGVLKNYGRFVKFSQISRITDASEGELTPCTINLTL